MIKIVFVNGKEIEFNDNEYIEAYVYENKLHVDTKTTTIYFPLYNILSYQIDEPAKEQRSKINKDIYRTVGAGGGRGDAYYAKEKGYLF